MSGENGRRDGGGNVAGEGEDDGVAVGAEATAVAAGEALVEAEVVVGREDAAKARRDVEGVEPREGAFARVSGPGYEGERE